MPHVTAIYAALGAILLCILGMRVVQRRRVARVGLGDGNDAELSRRIRAHGNAAENLPTALLLLLLLELGGIAPLWLHIFGAAFIAARVVHAVGLSGTSGVSFGRFWGMLGTWLLMLAMAVVLLLCASGLLAKF